ncbi:MAG: amidohydrolase family protein [Erysipelotrichaceae bacterium]|nr:amidohydrolase family protein [Erysipelotrichaceae bacterium]
MDIVTAMNAVTINPMKMLGINDKGLIKEGYKADIAVFNDRFENQATYIDGKLFERKG